MNVAQKTKKLYRSFLFRKILFDRHISYYIACQDGHPDQKRLLAKRWSMSCPNLKVWNMVYYTKIMGRIFSTTIFWIFCIQVNVTAINDKVYATNLKNYSTLGSF